jgi:hypothetical protein
MLKKVLTGALSASAMALPLAGLAWADPPPGPNPPTVPNANGQNPANPNPPAVPTGNGQNPANTATPMVAGSGGQSPSCVVSAGTPVQGPPGTTWVQVATLDGSVASELGLTSGQTMSVFCAPVGSPNVAERPTALGNPGQTNPQQSPAQNQPPPTGPQNAVPGQQ